MYNIPELTRQTTPWRAYETSFTYYSKAWNSHNWIRTPFGVCYAVWARVGSDLESTILGNGWVRTLNEGIVGSVDITLPATGPTPTGGQGHYSTVYIPIIKGIETFSDPATQLFFEWVHTDGRVHCNAWVTMGEFADSGVHSYNGYNQGWFRIG